MEILTPETALARVEAARTALLQRVPNLPKSALVLGSGLAAFGKRLTIEKSIPFDQIPNLKSASVSGHTGKILIGSYEGARFVCLQGRLHYYEGHSMADVVFPFRVLAAAGCERFLLTNAAGSLHADWNPGDLMIITDHINLMGTHPLRGPNVESWGPRFPDCTEVYNRELTDALKSAAAKAGVGVRSGVYLANSGPTYETPAEVRMYRALGGDAVGMSTVPEAIALHHMGRKVFGLSCVTNIAAGLSTHKPNHEDVLSVGKRAEESFAAVLAALCRRNEGGFGG